VKNYLIPHEGNPGTGMSVDALMNCSKVLDESDAQILGESTWLSWGNSWISRWCNWKEVLEAVQPTVGPIIRPAMDCLKSIHFEATATDTDADADADEGGKTETAKKARVNVNVLSRLDGHKIRPPLNASLSFFPDPKNMTGVVPLHFPCQPTRSLVKHGNTAMRDIFEVQGSTVCHVCEYMLLIDKVKEPVEHYKLWNVATETDFRDFSPVFMNDNEEGWLEILKHFEEEEVLACQAGKHSNPNVCASSAVQQVQRRMVGEGAAMTMHRNSSLRGGHYSYNAYGSGSTYERMRAERRTQQREVRDLLYQQDPSAPSRVASNNAGAGAGAGDSHTSMYRTFLGGARDVMEGLR